MTKGKLYEENMFDDWGNYIVSKELIDEAKKEYPRPKEGDDFTLKEMIDRLNEYHKWGLKWLGEPN